MLYTIVILFKCRTCIIWRINEYALNLPSKTLLQCLECNQIVTVNQHILAVWIAV